MFADRVDAGRRLADLLLRFATARPVVVGMARGGVPVAAVVAERLDAPLDVVVVRKIGVPWQPELGAGAIAEGDMVVFNRPLIEELGLSRADLAPIVERERAVLRERVEHYRAGRPQQSVAGRVVIVIDDGVATGFTAIAAVESLRQRGARHVVLAAPVAPRRTVDALRERVGEMIVAETPRSFMAIGEFYADFRQTSDEEIVALLAAATARAAAPESARSRAV